MAQVIEHEEGVNGEIPAGFLFASLKNIGTEVATVNGVELKPGEAKSYPFVGKPYNAISYITNDTTLIRIMRII